MRDIKFRAWDNIEKNMFKIFDSVENQEWFLPNWKERYIIQQYTGMKDTNGVEIYEGDICKWKESETINDEIVEDVFRVAWSDKYLKYIAIGIDGECHELNEFSDDRDFKIICNIYENTELFEVQE